MKLRISRRCTLLHPSEEIVALYCFATARIAATSCLIDLYAWSRRSPDNRFLEGAIQLFGLIENSLMHKSRAGHGEGGMVRVDRKCEAYV